MKSAVKKLLLATSIAAGMGGMFSAPALADSLKNAEIGGSASTTDTDYYYVYDSDGTNTFNVPEGERKENIQKVLNGNAKNPGGNVELAADSEKVGFDFSKNTTLMGEIGGQDITLSSLTLDDWLSTDSSGKSLGERWFDDALRANGFETFANITPLSNAAFSLFQSKGGFQRFSDPNISYVNQDNSTGLISIGLAGHFDATDMLMSSVNSSPFGGFANALRSTTGPIQASEIVKVTYNGVTDFLYSFEATKSGLFEKGDGKSHNGNYEVTLAGIPPQAVPEPSVMLGLLTVAGMVVSQRRMKMSKE